jgi:cell division protein FtsB
MAKIKYIVFALLVAAVGAGLAWSLFFSKTGLVKYDRLRAEHAKLVEQTRALEQENRDLANEAKALQDSDEYIEKVARDRMGMVKGDEVIFKFR